MTKQFKGSDTNPTVDSTIDRVKLRALHWKIWILSSVGILMEGFNLFVLAIALPLIKNEYNPSPLLQGIIGSSVIFGTIAGGASLGRIADLLGRKRVLFFNSLIVMIFSILAGFTPNIYYLIVYMFFLGFGVGADYPICASYVAELMPSRLRGKMLIGAFSFQAVGMLLGAIVGIVALKIYPSYHAWHWIVAFGAIPAIIIFFFRLTVPESPRWCIEHGRPREALRTISKLSFKSKEKIYKIIKKEELKLQQTQKKILPFSSLFTKKYIRTTTLAAVPWFFMDIATYGIGIFTPIIIASVITNNGLSLIQKDILSLECTAVIDLFLIIGFVTNILLVEKYGRIKLQLIGFLGMTYGLLILATSAIIRNGSGLYLVILFIGFIIYNFLMNAGPNATTFILPAELFPTKLRATAHGFAASFAKIGAVIGIFILPILKEHIGLFYTMVIIAITSFLGYLTTYLFKVETMGKSLDQLSHHEAGSALEHIVIAYKKTSSDL